MADFNISALLSAKDLNFSSTFKDAQAKISGLQESMSSTATNFKAAGDKMTGTGAKMSVGITAPLALIGKSSVQMAADFGQSMNNVQAMGDFTGDSMNKLKNLAMELGAKTKFSAGEAADAMGEFASAGFDADQITQAMPGSLSLAAAGQLDVARAVEISGAALSGFSLKADQTARVSDVLAKAAGLGALSVEDIGGSLKYVAPMASAAGYSIEETAAALTVMSNNGIKGEQAGTSFRAVIASLVSPSKETANTLKSLGMSIVDASGKMKPMSQIAQDFAEKTKLMSETEKVATAERLVGRESISAFLSMTKDGGAALSGYTTELLNSAGAADKMAETMNSGLAGALEEMSGSIETAKIKIGDALAPAIKKTAGVIQELANKFTNLDPNIQKTIVTFGLIAAALGPLLIVFGQISIGIGGLVSAFSAIGGALGIFGAAAEGAAIEGAAVGGALGFVSLPIVGLVAGLTALAAMFVCMYSTSETFRNAINQIAGEALSGLQTSFQALMESLGPFIAKITELTQAFLSNPIVQGVVLLAFQFLAETISGLLGGAFEFLAGAIKVVTSLLSGDLTGVFEGLKQMFGGAGHFFTAPFEALKNVVLQIFTWLTSFAQTTIDGISNSFTSKLNLIGVVFGNVFDGAKQGFESIKGTASTVVNAISGVVTSVFNGIGKTIGNVFDGVKKAWDGLGNFAGRVTSGIASAFNQVAQTIKNTINQPIGGINSALGIINKIPGVHVPEIPYLARGTDNWGGGFAVMNEYGKGELVNLPNGSQVIPHDISMKYAKESARVGSNIERSNQNITVVVENRGDVFLDGEKISDVTWRVSDRKVSQDGFNRGGALYGY